MAVFKKTLRTILCGAVGASMMLASGMAHAWDLATAAKPYSGTTIKAIFLDRPGYRAAIKMLRPGDLLLVAGKGHERGQIIGDKTLPFDDAAIVRAILAEAGE